jgi:acyl-CoA synthetase (AMP-forming)/AMP-acid ligase II
MAVAFVAIVSGATCAPLNPAYSEREFAYYLSDLSAKAVIVSSGMASPVRKVAEDLASYTDNRACFRNCDGLIKLEGFLA